MFTKLDIRKSALTLLAAAALSTAAGLASSAQASQLAAAAHLAAPAVIQSTEYGVTQESERNAHRLTRPANRFQGFVGTPGGRADTAQAR